MAGVEVDELKRKVVVVVRHGFAARYLLRTGILDALLANHIRVIILSPNEQEEYFRKEFQRDGVVLEHLEVEKGLLYHSRSRLQTALRLARAYSLNSRGGTTTVDIHYRNKRLERSNRGIKAKLRNATFDLLVCGLRNSRTLRKALIRFETWRFSGGFYDSVFERYKPDMLVASSLGIFEHEEYAMREAVRHGIPAVAVILSWDNTTTKGMAGAPTDYVIAQTERMRSELEELHDIPASRISVEGIASFDRYWHPEELPPREEFFDQVSLDPSRRLIVLATQSPNIFPWNADLVRMMANAIDEGKIQRDCQLLVRLHPLHFRRRDGKMVYRSLLNEYEAIQREHTNIVFNHPAILSEVLEADMPAAEMTLVAAMLRHADVLVNHFSTIAVEACIMDLPTINVGFEPGALSKATQLKHYCKVAENKSHNLRVVKQGGVRTVHSEDELYTWIDRYLENRTLDAEGRRRVCDLEAGPNRGHAAEAVGKRLLRILDSLEAPRIAPRRRPRRSSWTRSPVERIRRGESATGRT